MNNNTKHKYIPCEVKLVEFNVERGFAQTGSIDQTRSLFGTTMVTGAYFESWGNSENPTTTGEHGEQVAPLYRPPYDGGIYQN